MSNPRRESGERHGVDAVHGASGGTATELYTLGRVRLVEHGSDQTSKLGPKHLALLVYLFHEQRPLHPSEVTELLGRGQEEEKEITALKRVVAWLGDNVPGVSIRMTSDTIEAVSGIWVDSKDVDAAIDQGDPGPVETLYVGEFLEGFESAAPAFDEWAKRERGRIKRAWSHAMISAAHRFEREGDWETAARWWRMLVTRAPMRAEAVASLLGAYARGGQVGKAAQAYSDYAARLTESGITQPAAAVKQILAEHPALQEATGVQIEAPAEPAVEPLQPESESPASTQAEAAKEPAVSAGTAHDAPTFESISETLEAELEPEFAGEPEVLEVVEGLDDVPVVEAQAEPTVEEPVAGWPEEEFLEEEAASADEVEVAAEASSATTEPEIVPEDFEVEQTHYDADAAFVDTQPRPRSDEATFTPSGPGPATHPSSVAGSMGSAFVSVATAIGRVGVAIGSDVSSAFGSVVGLGRRFERARPGVKVPPLLRRFWYVPVALGAAVLAFALVPGFLGTVGELTEELPEVSAPSLPRVVTIPKVSVKTPSFVEISVSKIGEMLSGPILKESGQWILVADFEADEPPGSDVPSEEGALPGEEEAAIDDAVEPGGALEEPGALPQVAVAVPSGESAPEVAGSVSAELEDATLEDQGDAVGADTGETGQESKSPAEGDAAPGVTAAVPQDTTEPVKQGTDSARVVGLSQEAGIEPPGEDAEPAQEVPPLPAEVVAPAAEGTSPVWSSDGPAADLSFDALALALEADLAQSDFFYVVPRERAWVARASRTGRDSEGLPLEDALILAASEGYAAVISGRVSRSAGVDSLKLLVLNSAGDTLYGVAAEVPDSVNGIETLTDLAHAVRRRLGEPKEALEASRTPIQFLSSSPEALNAYAEAKRHLYAGRYPQAVSAAREATSLDSTFASAYLALAAAYAQGGVRAAGRSALEMAWQLSDRTTERERTRIYADRLAWDGQFSDAIVAYDEFFQRYRDDVAALKSQAILQRMIGARGGGEGNLRVAYTIDVYDWPRLSRVARYLGYDGSLPNIDSLVASLQEPPPEE